MSVNAALAERFSMIAKMMDLLGENRFKAIAHDRAARAIEGLSYDLAPIAADGDNARKRLMEIDGIGEKIADKIIEYCRTGSITELDELAASVPPGILGLMNIPGLGPKTVSVLWKEGGVTDLASLKKIIDDGSILKLPRMGAKSVDKLKESIALAEQGSARLPLGLAAPVAERFVARLKDIKGIKQIAFAGSLRRGKDTIGDIDILIATTSPAAASEAFRSMPEVVQVLAAGESKSSVRALINPDLGRWTLEGKEGDEVPAPSSTKPERSGPSVQVDLRVVPTAAWGAALMYFTGSKEHNVRLRELALKQNLTLNEYGLFPEDDQDSPPQSRGVKPVASRTEEDIYAALGFDFIPPELREDRGELDAFARKPSKRAPAEPTLVTIEDIKAELHAHTTASDGRMSIEELAEHAKKRGFHTIAVTDHSRSSAIANGLSVERLLEHIDAVHAAAAKAKGITILAGSEVDILADGSLDYPDRVLKQLDVVVASPHSSLSQDPATATKRLLSAIKNPFVHILGHPTGRLINRRPGLSPDIAALIAAAKEHDVALEINAHWMRLDLRDIHVRAAVDAGCLIAVDCDVHEADDYDNLRFGISTARRGWLTPDLCINTWPARKLHAWLKR
ncbi:MAG: PHP domain-containing protein [Phycisphaeraceae bacterium]|nr:PHP domain-containing protein [Phycisphaeraceae bacterium]